MKEDISFSPGDYLDYSEKLAQYRRKEVAKYFKRDATTCRYEVKLEKQPELSREIEKLTEIF